jgi:hypothetical protein
MLLAFGVARRWPNVLSNSVEPGWVPTKMGGSGAPDDLDLAPETQAWLAVDNETAATVTGRHFYHRRQRPAPHEAHDPVVQDEFLAYCADLTGTRIPRRQSPHPVPEVTA